MDTGKLVQTPILSDFLVQMLQREAMVYGFILIEKKPRE